MARGRLIDRALYRNTDVADLPVEARWLYVGTIIHADDEGRMKADARYLSAAMFPYDPPMGENGVLLEMNVREWRDRLADRGLITLYEKAGHKYLTHPNWEKWQVIRRDRFHASDCPAPTDDGCHAVTAPSPECPPARTDLILTKPNLTKGLNIIQRTKKRALGDQRIGGLIKEFFTRLETKLGEKPTSFNGGAAGRAFKRMLKTNPPEKIIERMASWFDSTDPFFVKEGWRIELFIMHFNTLKGGPIAHSPNSNRGYIGSAPVAAKYAALTNRPKHPGA